MAEVAAGAPDPGEVDADTLRERLRKAENALIAADTARAELENEIRRFRQQGSTAGGSGERTPDARGAPLTQSELDSMRRNLFRDKRPIPFKLHLPKLPPLRTMMDWLPWMHILRTIADTLEPTVKILTITRAQLAEVDLATHTTIHGCITESLSPADVQAITHCITVCEAIEVLRHRILGPDHMAARRLTSSLTELAFQPGETGMQLLDRAEMIAALLAEVHSPVTPTALIGYVLHAAQKQSVFKETCVRLASDPTADMPQLRALFRVLDDANATIKGGNLPASFSAFPAVPEIKQDPDAAAVPHLAALGIALKQSQQAYNEAKWAAQSQSGARGQPQRAGPRGRAANRKRQQSDRSKSPAARHGNCTPRNQQQLQRQHTPGQRGPRCYNCGEGHVFPNCTKPCTVCGDRRHSAHQCRKRDAAGSQQQQRGDGGRRDGGSRKQHESYAAHDGVHDANFLPLDAVDVGASVPALPPLPSNPGFLCLPAEPMDTDGRMEAWEMPPLTMEEFHEHQRAVWGTADAAVLDSPWTHTGGMQPCFAAPGEQFQSPATWVLDSGAAFHMTPHVEYLHAYRRIENGPTVGSAVGMPAQAVGCGELHFTAQPAGADGPVVRRVITNVLHIPGLTCNLLSQTELKLQGFRIRPGDETDLTDRIFDRAGTLVLLCTPMGRVTVADWQLHVNDALMEAKATQSAPALFVTQHKATDRESAELWHQRLGHAGLDGLYHLVQGGHAHGIKLHAREFARARQHVCEVCLMGKHAAAPFRPRTERAQRPLEVVHSDVCGPYPEGIGQGKYMLAVVDECTSKSACIVIESKKDVPVRLQEVLCRWRTQTGCPVIYVHTDRGTEFLGPMIPWYASQGIQHNLTVRHTPQQNGKAERLNETINNHARSMLAQYQLHHSLWPYAVTFANHVRNCLFNKRLGMTPHEAFHGRKPDLSRVRTFGCRVYARVHPQLRKKLDPKSEIGIYLGPSASGMGHMVLLYRPAKRAGYDVKECRDIVTYEVLTPCVAAQHGPHVKWGGPIALPTGVAGQAAGDRPAGVIEAHVSAPPDADDSMPPQLPPPPVLPVPSAAPADVPAAAPAAPLSLPAPSAAPAVPLSVSPHVQSETAAAQQQPAEGQVRWADTQHAPVLQGGSAASKGVPARLAPVFGVPGVGASASQPSTSASAAPAAAQGADPRPKKKQKKDKDGPPTVWTLPPAAPLRLPTREEADGVPIPTSIQQANKSPFALHWQQAVEAELSELYMQRTWELVDPVPGEKVIPCHWRFTLKTDADGAPKRFKARLVAGGNHQTEGVNYFDTYAPVASHATIRTLLAIAAHNDWPIMQLDCTCAFLNGYVDTEVYMRQPPGAQDGTNRVCKLIKCLYGLKQAPKSWHDEISDLLKELGFQPLLTETAFWYSCAHPCMLYMATVVDDIAATGPYKEPLRYVIQQILQKYKGTYQEEGDQYNGMKLTRIPAEHAIMLSQTAHIDSMIKRYWMLGTKDPVRQLPAPHDFKLCATGSSEVNPSPPLNIAQFPYRSLLGEILYIACCTRPDIYFMTCQLAKYSRAPTEEHWRALVNVARYLKGTRLWGIKLGHMSAHVYSAKPAVNTSDPAANTSGPDADTHVPAPGPSVTYAGGGPVMYTDASFAPGMSGSADGLRSITGTVLMLYGGPISWRSHTQAWTATSTAEAEYRAMSDGSREALAFANVLQVYGMKPPTQVILCDNTAAISAATSWKQTPQTKHIEIQHCFMREKSQAGELTYLYVPSKDNVADILTKPLGGSLFTDLRAGIGVCPLPPATEYHKVRKPTAFGWLP